VGYARFSLLFLPAVLSFISGCDTSTPLQEIQKSTFELIEHSAIHMQDGTGLAVNADTMMPGPHLEPDSIEHRRIDVTLPAVGSGYGGYIHFGPDVTGDMLVCVDISMQMSVTNRNAQGDTPLEIERVFTEREIVDSVNTTFIKSAIIFEAQTGGNIIKFEPVDREVIHVVIEEAEHDHKE
jgi:hypothetical protein